MKKTFTIVLLSLILVIGLSSCFPSKSVFYANDLYQILPKDSATVIENVTVPSSSMPQGNFKTAYFSGSWQNDAKYFYLTITNNSSSRMYINWRESSMIYPNGYFDQLASGEVDNFSNKSFSSTSFFDGSNIHWVYGYAEQNVQVEKEMPFFIPQGGSRTFVLIGRSKVNYDDEKGYLYPERDAQKFDLYAKVKDYLHQDFIFEIPITIDGQEISYRFYLKINNIIIKY